MRSALRDEPVSVLERILAILDTVRESHGSTTITQLALATGIPKSTVSRLVGDLVRQRYLSRTEAGVVIGLRLFELGARASTPRRLISRHCQCWPSCSTRPAST
jgi:IclR family transcriptional regulator, acetate operon repressor